MLGLAIIVAELSANYLIAKHLQLSYCDRLDYDLKVQCIDHVFVVHMGIMIPLKFYQKNCQFVHLCYICLI